MKKRSTATKLIALVICTMILIQNCFAVGISQENIIPDTDSETAYLICRNGGEFCNMSMKTPKSAEMIKETYVGGKSVWQLNNSGTVYPYLYFDVAESMKNSAYDGSEYTIEVDYYDIGNSYMIFWYDSLFYGKQVAGEIYLSGTEKHKTASFVLTDAAFRGGVDGTGDIMLSMYEKGSYVAKSSTGGYISEIRIKRVPAKNPVLVRANTQESGNVFEYYKKDKNVINTLTNTTSNPLTIECISYLENAETEYIEFEDKRTITLAAYETKDFNINLDSQKCGLYKWKVCLSSDDIYSEFECLTAAIVKTDKNGIKSEFGWTNTHLERYKQKEQQDLLDLIKKANIAGIRRQIEWPEVGRNSIAGGGYVTESSSIWDTVRLCRQNNVDMMFLLMGAGNNYTYTGMPDSDERVKGFEKFCEFVMQNTIGVGKLYEIWNEPNIKSFNPNNTEPKWMTAITKAARRAADKYNPDAKIAGMSITEIRRDDAHFWLSGTLESGIADSDGMDVMSLHTYAPNYPPEETEMYNVIKNDYISAVNEYGKEDIPVAVTEFGYNPKDTDGGLYDQSNWNTRAAVLFKSEGVGDYMFQYCFERKGMLDSDREDNFGMVSSAYEKYNQKGKIGIPRIAYLSYAAMNYMLGGHITPNGSYESDDKNIFARRFKSEKFDADVLALWAAKEDEYVTVDLGLDKIDCYDNYGNVQTLYGKNGKYTFALNEKMTYLVGNFKDFKITYADSGIITDKTSLSAAENDNLNLDINVPYSNEYTVTAKLNGRGDIECSEKSDSVYNISGEICGKKDKFAYLDLYLKENNRVAQYYQIPITFNDEVSSNIEFIPSSSDNYDLWTGTLNVKNNTMGSILDCTVEFSAPYDIARKGTVNIGKIGPGEEREIKSEFDGIIEKGFKDISYRIILNDGKKTIPFEQKCDFNMATYANKQVVIDGKRDEWPTNTAMNSIGPSNFKALGNFACKDANDKSANVSVMWDDKNLYLYSEITDDIYYQTEEAKSAWKGDGIQFGLYVDTGEEDSLAIGQAYSNFNEFGISLTPDESKTETYRFKTQNSSTAVGLCETAIAKTIRDANKTYVEWSMPWDDITGINGWSPKNGEKLGFSMLWNDNDGDGRKGWLEYASGIGVDKNRLLFTYLYFIK